ncbi:site-2 protease family protein [Roseimaritima ulvae]|uniref:Peptidase family M50 n=1 Tax=Roseimaritima ulvae TaxID=980254 RepID=A0A5B9R154_9BACT|nr:site-2 protease family protein [Roseimaritima ulvae]QEG43515.1 Peptidase family M50 [Roseimaritima ulvae]
MLLQEPARSPYDVEFRLGDFPVRIAWTFWLMAAIFGYNIAVSIDTIFLRAYELWSPGVAMLLLVWAVCIFVSILVHELGHAVAFRMCGIHSTIVLYHFGGLAIPVASGQIGRSPSRLSSKENLMIAAAGPFAQLVLAAVVVLGVRLAGYEILLLPWMIRWVPGAVGGEPILNIGTFAMVNCLVWPSVMWAVLNLVPVWPLDGGRIARELFALGGGTLRQSLIVSLIAAALLAAWGLANQQVFLGILFASLAFGNWEMLQSLGNWRRY